MVMLPNKVKGYKSKVINRIIDFMSGNFLTAGDGIVLSKGANGVTISAKRRTDPIEKRRRFDVQVIGVNNVRVYAGSVTRNGTKVNLTLDGGGADYKTLTGLSATSTTYYIYVTLSDAMMTYDASILPDTLIADKDTTWNNEDFGKSEKFLLATVTTDSSGYCKQPVIIHQGDIDDTVTIADSNTGFATPLGKSIGRNVKNLLEIFGFSTVAAITVDEASERTGRDMIVRDTTTTPDEVKYIDLATFKAADADTADTADDLTDVTTWAGHPHEKHTVFNTDDHIGAAPTYLDRYIRNNGDHIRNNMSGTIGDGQSPPKESIAPHARELSSSDGSTTVLKWELAGDAYALYFAATQQWNKDTFLVNVAGVASIAATGVSGAINLSADQGGTWTFKANLYIDCDTDNTDYFYIGSLKYFNEFGVRAQDVKLVGNDGGALYLGNSTPFLFTNIYYNGVTGVSITNWTTKGGVTGTGITEISASDLLATDKILVVR